MRAKRGERGAVLAGVILLLTVMAILVPVMVLFTQREAKWSVKSQRNMNAFHAAESGIEKGFRALTVSTGTWYALVQNGTGISDFLWDHEFDDFTNAVYAVGISSGPEAYQATVVSIGKDRRSGEVRAIKAIFAQNHVDTAIQAQAGVVVAGGVDVEWGAVVGHGYIDTGGRTFPQFHSSAGLSVDNINDGINCDQPNCCQWHAFSPDVPPDPKIDLEFYRSSAAASTCSQAGGTPAGSCYYKTAQDWSNFTYTEGGTVMIENNLTVGSPGVDIKGNLVVTGNMATTSGGWGKGSGAMSIPQTAWKQYCNNWSHFRNDFYDDDGQTVFPGLGSGYVTPSTLTYTPIPDGKTAVRGFIYVGGSFSTSGGGGNAYVYGNMFCKGAVSVAANSGVTVFYNKEAAQAVRSMRVVLTRIHWQDVLRQWPF